MNKSLHAALLLATLALASARADVIYTTVIDDDDLDFKVVKITADGAISNFSSGFASPLGGIAVNSTQTLYVVDDTNIYSLNALGNASIFAVKPHAVDSTGLAIDAHNNIYTSGYSANFTQSILKYNSIGSLVATWEIPDPDLVPLSLAFDSLGNLFVTEPYNNTIGKYDSAGTRTTYVSFDPAYPDGFFPFGLAIDASNNLYASGGIMADLIYKVAASDQAVTPYITAGLDTANGLAFTSQGVLLIANEDCGCSGNSTIVTSTSANTTAVFAILPTSQGPYFLVSVVPEPSTWSLFAGLAVLGLVAVKSRRARR